MLNVELHNLEFTNTLISVFTCALTFAIAAFAGDALNTWKKQMKAQVIIDILNEIQSESNSILNCIHVLILEIPTRQEGKINPFSLSIISNSVTYSKTLNNHISNFSTSIKRLEAISNDNIKIKTIGNRYNELYRKTPQYLSIRNSKDLIILLERENQEVNDFCSKEYKKIF